MQTAKRILITGATGFIGKYLIEEAIHQKFEVYIALRPHSKTDHLNAYTLNYITIDYTSYETISTDLKNTFKESYFFDYIIHNAGVKDAVNNIDFYRYNATLTLDLACAIKSLNLLKFEFIYMSSLAASGPGNPINMENIIEEKHSKPISAYGRSKLLAEKHIKSSGLSYLILRPTSVYGNGTRDYDFLITSLKKGVCIYLGAKHQSLSFIHAEDLAKICFTCINQDLNNHTFLVSDSNIYTTEMFYFLLIEQLKSKILVNFKLPRFIILLIAYIQQILRIKSPLNSVDKCNEVLALNWKCKSNKLYSTIHYEPIHSLSEIANY